MPPIPRRLPYRARTFDWDRLEEREIEVLERNGSLAYVEFENGDRDWIGREQIEE